MQMNKLVPRNKKGGVVTNTIMGVGGLIIGVIIVYVIINTLFDAGLITGTSNQTAYDMQLNFTKGIQNVSEKIPTILLIVAVVFLFGALILLIRNSKLMGIGSGSSL